MERRLLIQTSVERETACVAAVTILTWAELRVTRGAGSGVAMVSPIAPAPLPRRWSPSASSEGRREETNWRRGMPGGGGERGAVVMAVVMVLATLT